MGGVCFLHLFGRGRLYHQVFPGEVIAYDVSESNSIYVKGSGTKGGT